MTAKKTLSIIIICILAAFGAGWLVSKHFDRSLNSLAPVDVRINSEEYKFINPLLFSRTSKDLYRDEYKDLTTKLNSDISGYKTNNGATGVSIYFRDLNTSHWMGINDDEKYDPASLLKVVLLITYLKKSEEDPSIFEEKLYYPGADEEGQYYKGAEHLQPGNHTVLELLKIMIIESDNKAKEILTNNLAKDFQETYKDFRLPLPASIDVNDYMSARSYSVLFRALFNSTYLPWNLSEQALFLLSLANFDKGIKAGVPEGIVVSNKFGEHTYMRASDNSVESRELHDCGIVYYPGHPYLLCVMTRGTDFPQLEKVISEVSKTIYDYVESTASII
jgi:beta-lactamase class A